MHNKLPNSWRGLATIPKPFSTTAAHTQRHHNHWLSPQSAGADASTDTTLTYTGRATRATISAHRQKVAAHRNSTHGSRARASVTCNQSFFRKNAPTQEDSQELTDRISPPYGDPFTPIPPPSNCKHTPLGKKEGSDDGCAPAVGTKGAGCRHGAKRSGHWGAIALN